MFCNAKRKVQFLVHHKEWSCRARTWAQIGLISGLVALCGGVQYQVPQRDRIGVLSWKICAVCPRISDPFYIVTYYLKWVTTSWTDGTLFLYLLSIWYIRKEKLVETSIWFIKDIIWTGPNIRTFFSSIRPVIKFSIRPFHFDSSRILERGVLNLNIRTRPVSALFPKYGRGSEPIFF